MSIIKMKLAVVIFGIVQILGATPLFAAKNSEHILSELIKTSVHRMVMDVQKVKIASEKRETIGKYLHVMENGLAKMDQNPSLLESDRIVIGGLRAKFHQSASELKGLEGSPGAQDQEFDSFATYIQQGWEQAGSNLNGGIYFSTGGLVAYHYFADIVYVNL